MAFCRSSFISTARYYYFTTMEHTHAYTRIHTHTRAYTRIHTHTHAYTHIHPHTFTYIRIHTHTHAYTRIHTHTHEYTRIHTHTRTYTRIHTHIHTYTRICTNTRAYTRIHAQHMHYKTLSSFIYRVKLDEGNLMKNQFLHNLLEITILLRIMTLYENNKNFIVKVIQKFNSVIGIQFNTKMTI